MQILVVSSLLSRLVLCTARRRPSLTRAALIPYHRRATHGTAYPEHYSKTLNLPDGRQIAWAEAGAPSGFPCFMFHGYPGSRLEARGLEDIGRRHDVRFVCPDRPGYGLSTFQPNRRILDWPADVQFLAGHLNMKRYAVLGGSGGGPYALACAYTIPPESLSATGLMCTAALWEAGTHDILWSARLGAWASRNCPSLAERTLDLLLNAAKRVLATNRGKSMVDALALKAMAIAGKEIPGSEAPEAVALRRERLIRIFLEPFRQGSKVFVQEAKMLSRPWGFRLENVSLQRVQIWHGTKDKNSPIQMVRYMAGRLPRCDLHEYEGGTHFTIMKHLESIVEELMAQR